VAWVHPGVCQLLQVAARLKHDHLNAVTIESVCSEFNALSAGTCAAADAYSRDSIPDGEMRCVRWECHYISFGCQCDLQER
jgi:hypothetical protein